MSNRLPEDEYRALCEKVMERDGWRCRHCGMRNNLHAHHIIFRSQGGPDLMINLITLCLECHEAVHRGDLLLVVDPDAIRFYWNTDGYA